MSRKPDPRQLDLLDRIEAQSAPALVSADQALAMRAILQSYHDGAVSGDHGLQGAAIEGIWHLARQLTGQAMQLVGSIGEAYDLLFQATAAKPGQEILFGQAFEREVNLGPCKAILVYKGFQVVGIDGCLKAVDTEPFVSETGYRTISVEGTTRLPNRVGYFHELKGRTPFEFILEKATQYSRDGSGKLKLVPWKPFDYRTHSQKMEAANVAA